MIRTDSSCAGASGPGALNHLRSAGLALFLGLSSLGAQAQPYDGIPGREHGHGHGHRKGGPGHGPHGHHAGPRHAPPPPRRTGTMPPRATIPALRRTPAPTDAVVPARTMTGTAAAGCRPCTAPHHYVVQDWRVHHLAPPPHGYHWVQNGPDYLLISVGSGVIAQIVFR